MKRSLIMSSEATLTPRLLSSAARSCLRTCTSRLYPEVALALSSLKLADKAASSSLDKRDWESAMVCVSGGFYCTTKLVK